MGDGLREQQWSSPSSNTVWTVTTIDDNPKGGPYSSLPQVHQGQHYQYERHHQLTDLPPSYSAVSINPPPIQKQPEVVQAAPPQQQFEVVTCPKCQAAFTIPAERDMSSCCADCVCCLAHGLLCAVAIVFGGFIFCCWSADCFSEKTKCPNCNKSLVITRH